MTVPAAFTTLQVDLRPGDSLRLGDVELRMEAKPGRAARLRVTAPHDTPVKHKKNPDPTTHHAHGFVPSEAE